MNRIPVSTPERTIVDISARFDLRVLGRVLDDALRRKIATLEQLTAVAARLPPAPGRSRKNVRTLIERRDEGLGQRESTLEDFVFDALRRFDLPLPVAQHRVRVNGRKRRIDLCYPDVKLAIEAKGFDPHSKRSAFDADALRGNELLLAGFRVLEFTSAFTDWQIAVQVAEALGRRKPRSVRSALTFAEWLRRRERLCT